MAIQANGRFGQIQGPFTKNTNLKDLIATDAGYTEVPTILYANLGITYAEKDAMIFGQGPEPDYTTPYSLRFQITNGTESYEIWLGRTQMYETDQEIGFDSLVFLDDAPASVIIDYRLGNKI